MSMATHNANHAINHRPIITHNRNDNSPSVRLLCVEQNITATVSPRVNAITLTHTHTMSVAHNVTNSLGGQHVG